MLPLLIPIAANMLSKKQGDTQLPVQPGSQPPQKPGFFAKAGQLLPSLVQKGAESIEGCGCEGCKSGIGCDAPAGAQWEFLGEDHLGRKVFRRRRRRHHPPPPGQPDSDSSDSSDESDDEAVGADPEKRLAKLERMLARLKDKLQLASAKSGVFARGRQKSLKRRIAKLSSEHSRLKKIISGAIKAGRVVRKKAKIKRPDGSIIERVVSVEEGTPEAAQIDSGEAMDSDDAAALSDMDPDASDEESELAGEDFNGDWD